MPTSVGNVLVCGICLTTLVLMQGAFTSLHAQESRLYAINDPTNADQQAKILLKWYSPDFSYANGVNLYRRPVNTLQWTKLNQTPIIQKDSIDSSEILKDPDLEFFQDAVKQLGDSLQDNFVFINVLVKTFESDVFSDFVGIYYEDGTAVRGTTYEYRVNKIVDAKEVLIAASQPLKAGIFMADVPVQDVEAKQNGKTVDLNWRPEEYRFYAVNIYRSDPDSLGEIKLNKKPMLLTKIDSMGVLKYPNPFFREDSLKEGSAYAYQIAGVGFFGEETQRTESIEVLFGDTTAPPFPINLTIDSDSMKVSLAWENIESEDIEGIYIYRSQRSDGPYKRVNQTSLPPATQSYVDTLTVPGPYYYFVASHDPTGNEGNSKLAFEEVADVMPPAKPQKLTILSDTARLLLEWEANNEADLRGYMIYRTVDANKGGNYMLLNADPIKENRFEQDLPKNVKSTFYYKILAIDTSYNKSKYSKIVNGVMPDVIPPEKPVIKYIGYEGTNIKVNWVANADLDLRGYHVYRRDTSTSTIFTRLNVNVLDGFVTAYTDRSATPNTAYEYYLEAVDSVSNKSQPSEIEIGYLYSETEPIQVKNIKIKYNKRKKTNTIQWQIEDTSQILGYVVFRGSEEANLKPITGVTKDIYHIDKGVSQEAEYFYQIKVFDQQGQQSGSEIIKWTRK